jgi:hypothetical protein
MAEGALREHLFAHSAKVYGPQMLKRVWLVAGVALSCSSPQRDFSASNKSGTAGQAPAQGEAGSSNGGSSNGGSSNGGSSNGGSSNGGSSNGGSSNGGSSNGGAGVGVAGVADDGGEAGWAGESAAGGKGESHNCAGCLIDSVCIDAQAKNPNNSCEICEVSRSRISYSANLGAHCGSAATECSAQDTCDASGACRQNDLDSNTPCAGGTCEAGGCQAQQNPFDCIAPNPPKADFTAEVYDLTGTPPTAKGGVIADGRYTATRIDLYNSAATGVDIRSFEFKRGFVQISSQYYTLDTKVAFIPEVRFAGSYTIAAGSLKFNVQNCDPQFNIVIPDLLYTASANGIVTIVPLSDGTTIVTSYVRQ